MNIGEMDFRTAITTTMATTAITNTTTTIIITTITYTITITRYLSFPLSDSIDQGT